MTEDSSVASIPLSFLSKTLKAYVISMSISSVCLNSGLRISTIFARERDP